MGAERDELTHVSWAQRRNGEGDVRQHDATDPGSSREWNQPGDLGRAQMPGPEDRVRLGDQRHDRSYSPLGRPVLRGQSVASPSSQLWRTGEPRPPVRIGVDGRHPDDSSAQLESGTDRRRVETADRFVEHQAAVNGRLAAGARRGCAPGSRFEMTLEDAAAEARGLVPSNGLEIGPETREEAWSRMDVSVEHRDIVR